MEIDGRQIIVNVIKKQILWISYNESIDVLKKDREEYVIVLNQVNIFFYDKAINKK